MQHWFAIASFHSAQTFEGDSIHLEIGDTIMLLMEKVIVFIRTFCFLAMQFK